jgi:hypothetical protein
MSVWAAGAAVVGAVVTATTAGIQASNASKASQAAKDAAAADANARAVEERNAQSEQEGQNLMASLSGGADPNAGGDPGIQHMLEKMGYLAPSGGSAVPGQNNNPPDPSGPRQQVQNARNGTTA